LAAIILWIIIGFYNQTYVGEESLGMLGAGVFSAISAVSMLSFMTMINIFTPRSF